ncbi:GxxExxY protein [Candidatus Beckwithbacteria bacterium]|nr:GxxExxY protein [Candidatus Beckwithbacteria bacterium]
MSYKIIGIAFDLYNEVGFGMNEKYYQRLLDFELKRNHYNFEKEKLINLKYKDQILGKYFADFIAEDKILVN